MQKDSDKPDQILQIVEELRKLLVDPSEQTQKILHILRARKKVSAVLKGTFVEPISDAVTAEAMPMDDPTGEAVMQLAQHVRNDELKERYGHLCEKIFSVDLGL